MLKSIDMMRRGIYYLFCLIVFGLGVERASAEVPAAPAQYPVDWRFGIVETYQDPAAAAASGAAWTRVRFQWADVQQGGPESWTPAVSDAQINTEVASGRKVVGLLIGIPDWANEGGLPRGLYLPHTDPNNTWATFVRTSVGRYDGLINNWVIWNEPDVWDKNAPGHTWDGTVEDFAQLIKVAYLTAKDTNPDVVIHMSAFTYFWDANYGRDQYFARLLDIIIQDPNAAENNYYFDVATAHLYFQPEVMHDVIRQFYGMMSGRGILKPLWVIESNAPPTDDPAWEVPNWTFWVTQHEQARYIPQAFALSLAAGASRIAIYKMRDLETDYGANPEPFGLVRQDGSRRPAFNSYRVAVQYMAGVESSGRVQWDSVGHIKLNQGNKTTHVLFNRSLGGQAVQVEATAPTAILADMWGNQRSIAAQDGVFTVGLEEAGCSQLAGEYCMIGGDVFYLVQSVDGGSASAPGIVTGSEGSPSTESAGPSTTGESDDRPESSESPEPVDTATPTEEPTPTATPTETPSPTETAPPTLTPSPTPTETPSPTPTATPTETATPLPVPTLSPEATSVPATAVAARIPTAEAIEEVDITELSEGEVSSVPFPALALIGLGALLLSGLGIWWRRSN